VQHQVAIALHDAQQGAAVLTAPVDGMAHQFVRSANCMAAAFFLHYSRGGRSVSPGAVGQIGQSLLSADWHSSEQ
jgi:hypothetical protein